MSNTTIEIQTKGEHSDEDLLEFLQYELASGCIDEENPFYDGTAEITFING